MLKLVSCMRALELGFAIGIGPISENMPLPALTEIGEVRWGPARHEAIKEQDAPSPNAKHREADLTCGASGHGQIVRQQL